ncbi:LL-diaminopimelate aminotransferase [Candidatus Saccharibacteria bacterium RIFCSPHIGHO2_12_FULL_41_12]|nr:MAG: LL-diaminopimelate aminotransferase [Candidatus Saccharibacteria bacterium RIFCSPHIGHO2_12_FULL_41_12]
MAHVNETFGNIKASYLFTEIADRTSAFTEQNPEVELIRLGIGDTTLPLTQTVIDGMHKAVDLMSDPKTYMGYGDERGMRGLREAVASHYERIATRFPFATRFPYPDEVFVNDGAKSDTAGIQTIFSPDSVVAAQDPTYPPYVEAAVMGGKAGRSIDDRYEGIVYMPCTKENGFFPEVPSKKVDIIYLCNPNNPTGAVATHDQLKTFVDYAREHKAVIIHDAAYSGYISDKDLPRTIYQVDGANECAIEICSFSKTDGFTGVRLGWTIIPDELVVEGTEKEEVKQIWGRKQATTFNGASNIAQLAGIAALTPAGQKESQELIDYYMGNARIIRENLGKLGMEAYGGENAPFVWVKTPNDLSSWDFFDKLMQEAHVVGTPGVGFGRQGEGFVRLSAFGARKNVKEAVERIGQLKL